MWVTRGYFEDRGVSFGCHREPSSAINPVRVLVQEIPEGMPEFGPGDKVRVLERAAHTEVDGYPYKSPHGGWWVPLTNGEVHHVHDLTKLPPETSRLIRVTGPNENALDVAESAALRSHYGVRVEVVDDATDGGER